MSPFDRRTLPEIAAATAGAASLPNIPFVSLANTSRANTAGTNSNADQSAADYTLTIAAKPLEIAPKRIISVTTYNGQFPGPLLRLKEGEPVTIDIRNETDTPEQFHWHGQFVSTDVDGAAEEGTPFIPPHGSRRISFVPRPSRSPLLPHPRPRRSRSCARSVQRPGRSRLHRTQTASRQLRSRSLPHPQRISAHPQPRWRHGSAFPLARANRSPN